MPDFTRNLAYPGGVPGAYEKKSSWRETGRELRELELAAGGELRSMIDPLSPRDPAYARELAHLKRFVECWKADGVFREALGGDPRKAAREYGIEIDPEPLRPLWEGKEEEGEAHRLVRRYRFFVREKLLHREKLREVGCVPSDPAHRAWRQRQVQRSLTHLGAASYEGIVHAPFAVELSDGCSVGCWFCGVSAKKKGRDFLWTPGAAKEWREILGAVRERLGDAAGTGFLYWGTEPLDNPDYERFAEDFAEICGRFPQTTTAVAHRDAERTRRLLQLSTKRGCTINRFSILSLSQFREVMRLFSPEELLYCELITHNKESVLRQSLAGRAFASPKMKGGGGLFGEESKPGTIACVSGFLVNMVRRTLRLVTPCPACEKWPDGYWVLAEREFGSSREFACAWDEMGAEHFRGHLAAGSRVRFRADLRFEEIENGFSLEGRGIRKKFWDDAPCSTCGQAGKAMAAGVFSAGEIALRMEDEFGGDASETFRLLNQVFDAGLLDEEPGFTREGQ